MSPPTATSAAAPTSPDPSKMSSEPAKKIYRVSKTEQNGTFDRPTGNNKSAAAPAGSQCARCSASASRKCTACPYDEENDTASPTWYCNDDCQKADWFNHKARCSHVRMVNRLYRTARFAEAAFCAYRKTVFDLPIARVVKANNKLTIYGAGQDERLHREFPEQMFDEDQDRKAALTLLACDDALGRMHHLVGEALKGVYEKVEEIHFKPKMHMRVFPAILIQPDGTEQENDDHIVLRVTLKDKTCYIMDICEAQYGWTQLVYPWNSYSRTRVAGEVIRILDFGAMSQNLQNWTGYPIPEGKGMAFNGTQATNHLNTIMNDWLKQQGISLSDMMGHNKATYEQRARELLCHMATSTAEFVDKASKTNEWFVEAKTRIEHSTLKVILQRGDGTELAIYG